MMTNISLASISKKQITACLQAESTTQAPGLLAGFLMIHWGRVMHASSLGYSVTVSENRQAGKSLLRNSVPLS